MQAILFTAAAAVLLWSSSVVAQPGGAQPQQGQPAPGAQEPAPGQQPQAPPGQPQVEMVGERQLEGTVMDTQDAPIQGTDLVFKVALLQTEEGPVVVDLGPAANLQEVALEAGAEVKATGTMVEVEGRPFLVAERFEVGEQQIEIQREMPQLDQPQQPPQGQQPQQNDANPDGQRTPRQQAHPRADEPPASGDQRTPRQQAHPRADEPPTSGDQRTPRQQAHPRGE